MKADRLQSIDSEFPHILWDRNDVMLSFPQAVKAPVLASAAKTVDGKKCSKNGDTTYNSRPFSPFHPSLAGSHLRSRLLDAPSRLQGPPCCLLM